MMAGCTTTPPAFDEELRSRTFDAYWSELDRHYPFFDTAGPANAGVDWAGVRDRYRPYALAAEERDEFYHVLVGMLSELEDPHVALTPPPESPGEPTWTIPELSSRAMVDRGWYITDWGPNPAPEPPSALRGRGHVYPRILRVDGQRPSITLVDDLLIGRPGTDVELELVWPDGSVTSHAVRRPEPPVLEPGNNEQVEKLLRDPLVLRQIARLVAPCTVRRVDDIGYLRVDTFDVDDGLLPGSEFTKILDKAVDQVIDCRGIILDLRNNPGGDAGVMSRFVSRFTDRPISMGLIELPVLWVFPVDFEWEIRPREPLCNAKIAILTRPLTGSSAEHAAAILRRRGNCVIVGARTAGAEAAVETFAGPDGSVLNYGRRRIVDREGRGLQFVGVEPDIRIEMTEQMLETLGADTAGRELQERRFLAALAALDAENLWPRLKAELPEFRAPGAAPAPETGDESVPEP
jgi:C-terminal processing protease CtpA/Prc